MNTSICCLNCKNNDLLRDEEPCKSCDTDLSNFKHNWCLTCKHRGSSMFKDPCCSCGEGGSEPNTNYEPVDTEDGKTDMVNHPAHYQGKNECIDVMEVMFGRGAVIDFCRCNAFKYRFRADKKNGEEDIKKAEWYETKLIELMNSKDPERW